jgi:hypothetical protein
VIRLFGGAISSLIDKKGFHICYTCIFYVNMSLAGNVLSHLTVTNLLLGLIAYVALKFGWQIVYYRFFHPLAKFPGPFWASVTRLWIAKHNLQETEVPTVYALAQEYGQSCLGFGYYNHVAYR